MMNSIVACRLNLFRFWEARRLSRPGRLSRTTTLEYFLRLLFMYFTDMFRGPGSDRSKT